MEKATRRRYTLEYKQEAVRLVESGQRVAAAAKSLGIMDQTLAFFCKIRTHKLNHGQGKHSA